MENNSEDVHIGKVLHELKNKNKSNTEIQIDNIKIDQITDEYVTELKKSDADVEACKWQLLYYLKILKNKGIERKGKVEFIEKNKQSKKIHYVELNADTEKQIDELVKNIKTLVLADRPPEVISTQKCRKCAYYEYCYI